MKKALLFIAVTGAVTNSLVMVVTWWWAAFHGGQATVILNRYHEYWVEGIIFHAFAFGTAWAIWRYWGKPKVLAGDLNG